MQKIFFALTVRCCLAIYKISKLCSNMFCFADRAISAPYHVYAEFFSTKQGRRDENPLPSATNFPPWRSDLWLAQTLEVTNNFSTRSLNHPQKGHKELPGASFFCWVKLFMLHQQFSKNKGLFPPPSKKKIPLVMRKTRRTTVLRPSLVGVPQQATG